MQQSGMQQVRGEVQNLNPIELRGEQDRHVLAMVRTDSGQIERVNLGPEREVRRLNLQEGDYITLSGTEAFINDRPILMATRVNTDAQGAGAMRTAGLGQSSRMQGQVIELWEGRLQNVDDEHTLALVRLNQGQVMVVDLGPSDDIDDLDLDKGDQIVLVGRLGSIDGQQALLASSVATDDDSVTIDRERGQTSLRTRNGLPQKMKQSGGQGRDEMWDDSSSERDFEDR
jgi:hypothetical protein